MKSFALELCSFGGFPLKEESELLSQDNKGIIIWIYIIIVLIVLSLSINYFGNNSTATLHISFSYLTHFNDVLSVPSHSYNLQISHLDEGKIGEC
jgi:hypothetical protein